MAGNLQFTKDKMNSKLKHALVDHPEPAYKVAKQIGVHHSTISKFISGLQEPTEEQKKKLAKVLGKSVKELFDA